MPRLLRIASILVVLVAPACSDAERGSLANEGGPLSPFPSMENAAPAPGAGNPTGGAPNMGEPATSNTPSVGGSEGPPPITGGVDPTDPGTSPSTGSEPPGMDMSGAEPPDMTMDPTATPGADETDATPVTPSTGCGNANPPTGQLSLTIRGVQADYLVTLPDGYSPDTPVPLIFGFHGRNRTFLQFQTVDASGIQQLLGSRAVMVYMESQGGTGWNNAMEVPPSVEFWEQVYPQILASYCVDTSRVFAVGHSSGAIFSNILACRHGDLLRGVGIVAGDQQEMNCTGDLASILVHGPQDTVVAFSRGLSARAFALARSSCTQATLPAPVGPCVSYRGCEPGMPVTWCEHDEPTYLDMGQPTNHGWPSFATAAIADFIFSLP